MFSFFRRSKKEPETSGSVKEKKNKEKDMCKNNPVEIAPEGANVINSPNVSECEPKSFGSATAIVSAIETAKNISETSTLLNYSENDQMEEAYRGDSVKKAAMSYANMVKKSEVPKETRVASVKPCGHGTVGIAPRMPIMTGKRENSCTPPESPNIDQKNKHCADITKDARELPNSVCVKNVSLHNNKTNENGAKDDQNTRNNTVTGVMKLRVDLPITQTPKTGNSTPETPPQQNGTRNNHANDFDAKTKNLINQEAKFQSQLNDLSKQLSLRDAEANKLQFQMEELQRDVFAKTAGMDRLQAELQAAHKESESARQKLRHLESDLADYRRKNGDLAEELQKKSEAYSSYEKETNEKIQQLEGKIRELQNKIYTIETQIESLKVEKQRLEEQEKVLIAECELQKNILKETIEKANAEKEELDKKWKEDFEKVRTINIIKEQQLLDDFEWKLREVHQSCKKRLDEKDKRNEEQLQEAYKVANEKLKDAEDKLKEVERLKSYEAEVRQLRGLTNDQERSIKVMMEHQEEMKASEQSLREETKKLRNLIEIEKENLQHIQRLHHQDILERERKLQQTLDQKKTEIAVYWEERLLNECGRLKTELEQLYNEEKYFAIETIKREKEDEFNKAKNNWETKVNECLKEIASLKNLLKHKEEHYHDEMIKTQTKTDSDIIELRRIMDKIDMMHHEKFEKLVLKHEEELEKMNEEAEKKVKEVETAWQNQVSSLRATLELVKEQMERESQQKIENLIEQHRSELDTQWENLIHQKSEAIKLVEEEYVSKYKTLEEQFLVQQKSHTSREVELLKTIDSLKNEIESKESMIDDLQNNVDTLEGGVQVLNQEIAHQGEQLIKTKRDADQKIRGLQEMLMKMHKQLEEEREVFKEEVEKVRRQSQTTIDQLQRKCQCLTKLFEEIRARYEKRESRQEDLNLISDLRQVIAEQEKDLACVNEEKRYFQMKLLALERSLEEDEYEDAKDSPVTKKLSPEETVREFSNGLMQNPAFLPSPLNNAFSIPPTIPECDDCDE